MHEQVRNLLSPNSSSHCVWESAGSLTEADCTRSSAPSWETSDGEKMPLLQKKSHIFMISQWLHDKRRGGAMKTQEKLATTHLIYSTCPRRQIGWISRINITVLLSVTYTLSWQRMGRICIFTSHFNSLPAISNNTSCWEEFSSS